MAMTLIAAKPILQQDLYKAFHDAYMSQFQNNSEAGKYNNDSKKSIEKAADKFSQQLSKDMAQAIYDFVKEIGIEVIIPPTVISPSGPCTGSIPMTNFTIL